MILLYLIAHIPLPDRTIGPLVSPFSDYRQGSIASSATRRYLIYLEAEFEVFRPAGASGRHIAPMGVKFGTEEGIKVEGPLLRAKFHPHRCNDKGTGPPKLNFLLRFDQNVEYKRPTGASVSYTHLTLPTILRV